MTEQITNFGVTTVNEELDFSETTITVLDGSVFPDEGNFRVNVDDELMLVTARSTNDLTVVRGSEGTTAASHASGSTIKQVLTGEGLLSIIKQEMPNAYSKVGISISRRATAQTLTTGVSDDITWDTVEFDTDGFYPGSGDEITVPAGLGGWYLLTCRVEFDSNATGIRSLIIVDDADLHHVPKMSAEYVVGTNGGDTGMHISGYMNLSGGEIFKAQVSQGSGGNLDVKTCTFDLVRVTPSPTTADAIGCRVYQTTGTSIVASTHTSMEWDTVDWDTDGFSDTGGASPERLTIPAGLAGTYLAVGSIHYGTISATRADVNFFVNGVQQQLISHEPSAGVNHRPAGVSVMQLNAGDYVELSAFTTTSSLTSETGTQKTSLALYLLHSNGIPTRAGNQRIYFDEKTRTSGSFSINSTSWTDMDNNLDLTVSANAGDTLMITPNFLTGNQAPAFGIDVITHNAGTQINSTSGAGASDYGWGGWYCDPSEQVSVTGSVFYTVQPADVISGQVHLRWRIKTSSAVSRTIFAGTAGDPKLTVQVANLKAGGDGQANLPSDEFVDTSGGNTMNATSWTDLYGATGDISTTANVGDKLWVWMSCLLGAQAPVIGMDAWTRVGGSNINAISGQGGASDFGVQAWYGPASVEAFIGGGVVYTVQSGDIEDGRVTLRLRYTGNAAVNRTQYGSTADPFHWGVVNLKAAGDIKAFGTAGRGHTFPANPPIGEEFHRSDIKGGMDFMYDGNRWVSKQLFTWHWSVNNITSDSVLTWQPLSSEYKTLLTDIDTVLWVNPAAQWDVDILVLTFENTTSVLWNNRTTSGQTGGKWYSYNDSLDLELDGTTGNADGTDTALRITFNEVTGSSNFYGGVDLHYRLVAT